MTTVGSEKCNIGTTKGKVFKIPIVNRLKDLKHDMDMSLN